MSFPVNPLPTGPSETDYAQRDRFRNNLKIVFIVFCVLSAALLSVGIYLAVDPGRHTYGLAVFGYVLIALGVGSLITSAISGNLFFRLLSALSESKVYLPKQADQLRSKPYPRQPNSVRRRVIIVPARETPPVPISRPSRSTVASSIEIDDREIDVHPIPSAPAEDIVSSNEPFYRPPMPSTSTAGPNMIPNAPGEEDEIARMKRSEPTPETQPPPPHLPLYPDIPPPPYEEVSKM